MATQNLSPLYQSRFLNNHRSLEYTALCFYQIKIIAMMKNYNVLVEINHNPN